MSLKEYQVFLCLCFYIFTKPVGYNFVVGSIDGKSDQVQEYNQPEKGPLNAMATGNERQVFSISSYVNTSKNERIRGHKHKIGENSLTASDPKLKLYQNYPVVKAGVKQDLINHGVDKRSTMKDSFIVAKPEDHPYAVILFIFDKSKYLGCCSGSLLTLEWVLTAASHCFDLAGATVTHVQVYAGGNSEKEWLEKKYTPGYQLRNTSAFFVHSEYSREKFYVSYYDVALVKVDTFVKSSTVATIELYTKPWDYDDYVNCTLTGFGKHQFYEDREDDFVRKTYNLEAKSPCPCLNTSITKPHNWICSKPKQEFGICGSDWGAALVCDSQIRALAVAVISYKDLETCTKNDYNQYICSQHNSLSVLQNTFPCIKWINYFLKQYVEILNNPSNTGINLHYGILVYSSIIFTFYIGKQ